VRGAHGADRPVEPDGEAAPTEVAAVIARLGLRPHQEGGSFRELYRSADLVVRDGRARSALTTIYFLLAAGEHGRWHVVGLDEVWYFLAGEPLELLTYDPASGAAEALVLGPLANGGTPVAIVPRDRWQAARSLGSYSLVGCTVAPGFDFADFRFVADLPDNQAPFDGVLAAYRSLL
jgi:predicted cupin superfamily sugar epimerase